MNIKDLFPGLKDEQEDKQKATDWMKEKWPGLFPQWPKK